MTNVINYNFTACPSLFLTKDWFWPFTWVRFLWGLWKEIPASAASVLERSWHALLMWVLRFVKEPRLLLELLISAKDFTCCWCGRTELSSSYLQKGVVLGASQTTVQKTVPFRGEECKTLSAKALVKKCWKKRREEEWSGTLLQRSVVQHNDPWPVKSYSLCLSENWEEKCIGN